MHLFFAAFLMDQINEKAENERQNKEDDLRYDEEMVKMLSVEEDQFQQYADKVSLELHEKV